MRRSVAVLASVAVAACLAEPHPAATTGPAKLAYQSPFFAGNQSSKSFTLPAAADHAGDAIVVHLTSLAFDSPNFTVTGTGAWTFQMLGRFGAASLFAAIAPDTNPAMFTITTDTNVPSPNTEVLADEFTGNDPTGGSVTFGVANGSASTDSCSTTVTTRADREALWAATTSIGCAYVGSGFQPGVSDNGNVAEWQLTTDPAMTAEHIVMQVTPGTACAITAVAIKPAP